MARHQRKNKRKVLDYLKLKTKRTLGRVDIKELSNDLYIESWVEELEDSTNAIHVATAANISDTYLQIRGDHTI